MPAIVKPIDTKLDIRNFSLKINALTTASTAKAQPVTVGYSKDAFTIPASIVIVWLRMKTVPPKTSIGNHNEPYANGCGDNSLLCRAIYRANAINSIINVQIPKATALNTVTLCPISYTAKTFCTVMTAPLLKQPNIQHTSVPKRSFPIWQLLYRQLTAIPISKSNMPPNFQGPNGSSKNSQEYTQGKNIPDKLNTLYNTIVPRCTAYKLQYILRINEPANNPA